MKLIPLAAILLIFNSGCYDNSPKEPDYPCTEIYAMIGVQIEGDTLTDFYTIRTHTGDTLRYPKQLQNNYYSIVEDDYFKTLKNRTENFVFHGWVNGVEKINETYIIGADECHVFKQNGKDTIKL